MDTDPGMNRGWLISLGIVLILAGTAAVVLPFISTIAIELLVGWLFAISGVLQLLHVFSSHRLGALFLRVFGGIIALVAGLLLVAYPLQGAITITFILAVFFLLEGISKILVSIQLRPLKSWSWIFISGLSALILSGIIFATYPASGVWVIGLIVGVNLLLNGWSTVMLAVSDRT